MAYSPWTEGDKQVDPIHRCRNPVRRDSDQCRITPSSDPGHVLLGGENMDLMELQTCILSVVTIADTYDDLIIKRFGGQRACDRLP